MKNDIIKFYKKKFEEYGHHEASLGWSKGKQFIRFYALTRNFNLNNKKILDIGCGFGDFLGFATLHDIKYSNYHGVDLIEEFIKIAVRDHGDDPRNKFEVCNFLEKNFSCDYVIASGVFGQRVESSDERNYEFVEKVISKALADSSCGVAFDFISDKVDFRTSEKDFHASASRVLDIAYKYSRNVMIDNSIMPFEFSLVINKDQGFSKEKTVFNSFLNSNVNFVTDTTK